MRKLLSTEMRQQHITIVHDHIEQPADGIPFSVEVSLIE
ncbi:hypothetical protein CEXT_162281, partial [Caerostris extrusa]